MAVRWTGDPGSLKLDVEKPFIMLLQNKNNIVIYSSGKGFKIRINAYIVTPTIFRKLTIKSEKDPFLYSQGIIGLKTVV